jgi:hypothetical protein
VALKLLVEVAVEFSWSQEGTNPRYDYMKECRHRSTPCSGFKNPADHSCDPLPVFGFNSQLLSAGTGDGVELRPAAVFGCAPCCRDPFFLDEAYQAEIDGSLVDRKGALADLLDTTSDAITIRSRVP